MGHSPEKHARSPAIFARHSPPACFSSLLMGRRPMGHSPEKHARSPPYSPGVRRRRVFHHSCFSSLLMGRRPMGHSPEKHAPEARDIRPAFGAGVFHRYWWAAGPSDTPSGHGSVSGLKSGAPILSRDHRERFPSILRWEVARPMGQSLRSRLRSHYTAATRGGGISLQSLRIDAGYMPLTGQAEVGESPPESCADPILVLLFTCCTPQPP